MSRQSVGCFPTVSVFFIIFFREKSNDKNRKIKKLKNKVVIRYTRKMVLFVNTE